MPEKSGYEAEQEEFWHPDGSGRKVTKEVFERETAARQAQAELRSRVEGPSEPDSRVFDVTYFDTKNSVLERTYPIGGAEAARPTSGGGGPSMLGRIGRHMTSFPLASIERWVSLPLIGFGQRQSALHGQMEIFPQLYQADIAVSQIVGIAQVAEPEYQRHGALSDVFLRFGGKVFCTLTRQQLRQRLGIAVEEVAS